MTRILVKVLLFILVGATARAEVRCPDFHLYPLSRSYSFFGRIVSTLNKIRAGIVMKEKIATDEIKVIELQADVAHEIEDIRQQYLLPRNDHILATAEEFGPHWYRNAEDKIQKIARDELHLPSGELDGLVVAYFKYHQLNRDYLITIGYGLERMEKLVLQNQKINLDALAWVRNEIAVTPNLREREDLLAFEKQCLQRKHLIDSRERGPRRAS